MLKDDVLEAELGLGELEEGPEEEDETPVGERLEKLDAWTDEVMWEDDLETELMTVIVEYG